MKIVSVPVVILSLCFKLFFRLRIRHWILLMALCQLTTIANAQDQVLDRIRAVVNNGIVLESELIAAIEFFKTEAATSAQNIPQDSQVLSQRILEQLIQREVFRQHARQLGVAVDAKSVNRAVDQIAQRNNLDALRFRQTLQQQGIDYNLFRQNVEDELLRQRLIEREVQSRIRVSTQEIDDFVDAARNDADEKQKYRIQHILVSLPAAASSEQVQAAQDKAQALIKRIDEGENFARLATAESDGARALQGGDLGWRSLQELPELFASEVRRLSAGEHSGVVRSANGLHILRLAETQRVDPTQQAETLARHIFISGDNEEVEKQLNDLRLRINNGESFETLAERFSEDPNSAADGGELPWFSKGEMPAAMEQMADSLSINEISVPFRTQFGWHLLQLIDRRLRQIDEEALREQANNALSQRKLDQEIQRWSRQLRDESYVEVRN
ncbi:MAG: peptidylprolyl isomerase [Granulosicoccus sp.]|nr:peptidylprolyl isomerase [Granulosicoccus sp.]